VGRWFEEHRIAKEENGVRGLLQLDFQTLGGTISFKISHALKY